MKTMTMTMMGLGLGMTMTALAGAAQVQAGYHCVSHETGTELQVNGNVALLKAPEGATQFQATLVESTDAVFFSRSIYQLTAADGPSAKLTVVSRQKNCGRGGCLEFPKTTTSAKLLIGETEIGFSCDLL